MKQRLRFLRRRHTDSSLAASVRPSAEEAGKWSESFAVLMSSRCKCTFVYQIITHIRYLPGRFQNLSGETRLYGFESATRQVNARYEKRSECQVSPFTNYHVHVSSIATSRLSTIHGHLQRSSSRFSHFWPPQTARRSSRPFSRASSPRRTSSSGWPWRNTESQGPPSCRHERDAFSRNTWKFPPLKRYLDTNSTFACALDVAFERCEAICARFRRLPLHLHAYIYMGLFTTESIRLLECTLRTYASRF